MVLYEYHVKIFKKLVTLFPIFAKFKFFPEERRVPLQKVFTGKFDLNCPKVCPDKFHICQSSILTTPPTAMFEIFDVDVNLLSIHRRMIVGAMGLLKLSSKLGRIRFAILSLS